MKIVQNQTTVVDSSNIGKLLPVSKNRSNTVKTIPSMHTDEDAKLLYLNRQLFTMSNSYVFINHTHIYNRNSFLLYIAGCKLLQNEALSNTHLYI